MFIQAHRLHQAEPFSAWDVSRSSGHVPTRHLGNTKPLGEEGSYVWVMLVFF